MFVHDPDRYGLRGAGEISPQNDSLLHLSSAMGTPNLPSPPIDGCGCRGSWLSMFEGARLMEPWVGFVCRGRHAFSACSTRLQCETHTVSIGARRSRARSQVTEYHRSRYHHSVLMMNENCRMNCRGSDPSSISRHDQKKHTHNSAPRSKA